MITDITYRKTCLGVFLSSILKEPFSCLYPLLPFILLRELNATLIQIGFFTMLHPVCSIFSFYISELTTKKNITLRTAIFLSGFLARIAFIPALLFDNINLYILGSIIYIIFSKSGTPAWMEVIKKNVYRNKWGKTFSLGSIISYSSGVLFTLFFTFLLDVYSISWKSLFSVSLFLGVVGVFLQSQLFDNDQEIVGMKGQMRVDFVKPLRESFYLIKGNKSFRDFQWAFMIGGLGLMMIKPVLPIYFTDVLQIGYSDLMVAFSIYKALGFILSTPIWNTLISSLSYHMFLFYVFFGFLVYVLFLIFSAYSFSYLFVASFIYGIAQAGSHLIWNLSGPLFSKEDSSSRYTAVNIFMVGIRGLVGPFLGLQLLFLFSPLHIFLLSMFLFLLGGSFSLRCILGKKKLI